MSVTTHVNKGGSVSRISIDDEFWGDPRLEIMKETHSEEACVLAVLKLWRLGQHYWKQGKKLIPIDQFERLRLAEQLVRVSFADVRQEGVYCSGAVERWEFLNSDRFSRAGKASAAKRRSQFGTAKPRTTGLETTNERSLDSRTTTNVPEPSLSYSLSSSRKEEERESASGNEDVREADASPPLVDSESKKKPTNSLHKLAEVWNANCGPSLPKAKATTGERRRKCEARVRDARGHLGTEDVWEHFAGIVRRIAMSGFCTGKNDRGWRASFDWLLQSEVQWKVIEGKYDNKLASQVRLKTLAEIEQEERGSL